MNYQKERLIDPLAHAIEGVVIHPGHLEYDAERVVWNGIIDRYPAAIVRVSNAADVAACITFARENDLPLAVRGGGHNVAGHGTCDGGLVIDLSNLNQVEVDVKNQTVTAGGGTTIGQLDAATQPHGLAVPMGVVSATGIAGLTLGGGFGWLRNKFGLACDNLLAAQVVTAAGQVIEADAGQNSDLLWGLRGGGGNFGVVTRFTFRAHPVGPDVLFQVVFHHGEPEAMARGIHFYNQFSQSAPDEVSTILILGHFPPDEAHYPVGLHHKPYTAVAALYAGDPEKGREVLKPLLDFAEPQLAISEVMPYVEAQQAFDAEFPNGMRYYWKSLNLTRFDTAVIERMVAHAHRAPSGLSTIDLWHVGGAVKRADPETAAFFGRDALHLFNMEANWVDEAEDEANIEWVRSGVADMSMFSDGSRYTNFAGFNEEGDKLVQQAYGSQYGRLAQLKQKYDPDNLFSRNANIKPQPVAIPD